MSVPAGGGMGAVHQRGFCVWFTGLPSAGKSTLARLLEAELARRGRRAEVLDGDEVRMRLTKGLRFSREDRDENVRRIAYVARVLARNGVVAITAAISPYRSVRDEARAEIEGFVEVFVRCSLQVCVERDVKGLYRKALAGEVKNFTGVSDPYEEPLNPEIVIESDREPPDASVRRILGRLVELGHLTPEAAGMTLVPVPSYLVQEILHHRANGHGGPDVTDYVLDALSRRLGEQRLAVPALTPSEREAVESRLRQLGYLD